MAIGTEPIDFTLKFRTERITGVDGTDLICAMATFEGGEKVVAYARTREDALEILYQRLASQYAHVV
jgi:hypothetical protein